MYFISAAVGLLGSAMFMKLFFSVVNQMLLLTCLSFVTLGFLHGLAVPFKSATLVPPLNECPEFPASEHCVTQLFLFFERLVQTSVGEKKKKLHLVKLIEVEVVRFHVLSSVQQDGHIK